jgi:anti-sigma regulatory factor (Ser/Thr protein kinase)
VEPMSHASHECFRVRDQGDVGAASRAVDTLAQAAALPQAVVEPARIATTELGHNLHGHGQEGYLLLRPTDEPRGLEVVAVDRGPGIADPAGALAGTTAAADLGVGLGVVARLATSFDLYTGARQGTVVLARFAADPPTAPAAPVQGLRAGGVSTAAVPGDANGDGWAVAHDDLGCTAVVVDGLGHGPPAHEASRAALAALEAAGGVDVCGWLQAAHVAMRGTRGGVAAAARIDLSRRRVAFAGVGNVQGRIVAEGQTWGLASHPGMLGTQHQAPRPRRLDLPWPRGATLLLWSDGLRSGAAPGVDGAGRGHDPTVLAALLHRDFVRGNDDATVVVVQDRTDGR